MIAPRLTPYRQMEQIRNTLPFFESPDVMPQSVVLDELRARIAQIGGVGVRHATIPFGVAELDHRLPEGGIATSALHEIAGSRPLLKRRRHIPVAKSRFALQSNS